MKVIDETSTVYYVLLNSEYPKDHKNLNLIFLTSNTDSLLSKSIVLYYTHVVLQWYIICIKI